VTYTLVTDETNFILVHERSEEEKAQEMPDAHKVPQMLAAGWGGTGSVIRTGSVLSNVASFDIMYDDVPFGACMNASVLGTPAVWRGRTSAAARINALDSGSLDDYQIPAFLRKQVDADVPMSNKIVRTGIDKLNPILWTSRASQGARRASSDIGYMGITPAGIDRWLSINHQSLWPTTFAELRDLGLGYAICEWLEFEIGQDRDESTVVATFLSVLQELGLASISGLKGAMQSIKSAVSHRKVAQIEGDVALEIRRGLQGITSQAWPKSVVDFPEGAGA
jgi:Ca-activated chloride channel family protein